MAHHRPAFPWGASESCADVGMDTTRKRPCDGLHGEQPTGMKPALRFLGSFLFLSFILGGLAELILMAFGLPWNALSIGLLVGISLFGAYWERKPRPEPSTPPAP